jgi:hypothetical protein
MFRQTISNKKSYNTYKRPPINLPTWEAEQFFKSPPTIFFNKISRFFEAWKSKVLIRKYSGILIKYLNLIKNCCLEDLHFWHPQKFCENPLKIANTVQILARKILIMKTLSWIDPWKNQRNKNKKSHSKPESSQIKSHKNFIAI